MLSVRYARAMRCDIMRLYAASAAQRYALLFTGVTVVEPSSFFDNLLTRLLMLLFRAG